MVSVECCLSDVDETNAAAHAVSFGDEIAIVFIADVQCNFHNVPLFLDSYPAAGGPVFLPAEVSECKGTAKKRPAPVT